MGGGKCPLSSCMETFYSGKTKRRHAFKEGHGACVLCNLCNEPFLSERAREQHNAMYDHTRVTRSRPRRRKKATVSSGLQYSSSISGAFSFPESQALLNIPRISSRQASSQNKLYSVTDKGGLNSFIADEIQPESSFLDSNLSVVNKIVHLLQNNIPADLRPARVVKGGSLGKGTAVKENSDIDVTVVLGDIHDIDTLKGRLPKILSTLSTYLGNYSSARVTGTTTHAVQVELEGHDVDILPAMEVDIFNESALHQLYGIMGRNANDQRFFSSTISPLQLEIIRRLPTKLKSLIRLMKYWKKTMIKVVGVPVSYVLELVVIHAWQEAGSPTDFDMVGAVRDVLTKLVKHETFRVEFGGLRTYPAGMVKVGPGPYIIDPTNPFNDVYHGLFGNAWRWDAVALEASKWLKTELFNGVGCAW